MLKPSDRPHNFIQKRGGIVCQFCRMPFVNGAKENDRPCDMRAAREEEDAATGGLQTLRTIGQRMTAEVNKEKRPRPKRKEAKRT